MTITAEAHQGGGEIKLHKQEGDDTPVRGSLRMHFQIDLPAPLSFDLHTTHISTWVGVRPLSNGAFELTTPEAPGGVVVSSVPEVTTKFFELLLAGDNAKLDDFLGRQEQSALIPRVTQF